MSIANLKLDLAKKIIETDDKEIIGYIKAIFEGQSENWFEDLPADVQASVERGLAQSERGEGRPHSEVIQKYKKWLK
jgi:predicted transcriptional regulator